MSGPEVIVISSLVHNLVFFTVFSVLDALVLFYVDKRVLGCLFFENRQKLNISSLEIYREVMSWLKNQFISRCIFK